MNLLSRGCIMMLFVLGYLQGYSQELNIGVHFSPILSIPVQDKIGDVAPTFKTQTINFNASGGLNINARFNKICFETGANITSRTVVFKMRLDEYSFNNLNSSSTISSNTDVRAMGYAWSVPLQVGYLLDHHEAATTYDLFGIAGVSYENYTATGFNYASASITTGGSTTGNSGSLTNINDLLPVAGTQTSWYNAIVGFKINAILRRVGLVEYGMRYHYPLSNAGLFRVNAVVANNNYGSVFNGDFYPRLSYIDFHFTYYFLNFRERGKPRYKS